MTGLKVVFSSWPPFVPPPEHLIEPDVGEAGISGGVISVSDGYFSTFGIAITQGREFTAEEASAESPVAAHPVGTLPDALGQRAARLADTCATSPARREAQSRAVANGRRDRR